MKTLLIALVIALIPLTAEAQEQPPPNQIEITFTLTNGPESCKDAIWTLTKMMALHGPYCGPYLQASNIDGLIGYLTEGTDTHGWLFCIPTE